MLILPPGHAQELRTPRRITLRERWVVGAAVAMLAALAVVLVVALSTGEHASGNGCVYVNLPYSTGGASFYQCGSKARATCGSVGQANAFTGPAADAVATQCRKAGLPVGPAGA